MRLPERSRSARPWKPLSDCDHPVLLQALLDPSVVHVYGTSHLLNPAVLQLYRLSDDDVEARRVVIDLISAILSKSWVRFCLGVHLVQLVREGSLFVVA